MAKKFGKFLLFTAAAGAAAVGAYCYMQKKSRLASECDFDDDEDYDDFSEDLDETDSSRSYVPLSKDAEASASSSDTSGTTAEKSAEDSFSSLADNVTRKTEEKVEEFFDEEEAGKE